MSNQNQSPGNFINEVVNNLEAKDYASALNVFNDVQNEKYLKNNSWDLIPVLCKHITKESRSKNNELAVCCETLLEKLASKANPEEAVLEFLDQMDEADIEKFGIILKLLKIVLIREMSSRTKSLEWTLNSIRSYMEQYSYDKDADNFVDEKDDYYSSEKLQEIQCVTNSVILFFEDFVIEATENPELEEFKYLLSSRLLQMFDVFLPYINTQSFSQFNLLQCKISSMILQLISNPMTLLEFVFYRSLNVMKPKLGTSSRIIEKTDDLRSESFLSKIDSEKSNPFEDETIVSNLAYGMFFYCLLTESENEQARLPLVYNPKYIMLSLIYVTVSFFDTKHDTAVSNGLKFLKHLLNQLNDSLNKSDLYFSSHKAILIHLNNVMVYSSIEENRKTALECFKKYIESFNWEGRYLLLFNFRLHVHHSGTLGFLIGLLKDFMSTFLELPPSSQSNRKFIKYYKGKLLFDMIKRYCYLSNETGADLVESADHIISSLNVLRFLVLKDKKNVTDIKNFIRKIDKDFLKPLKDNIISSKNFYEAKLKDLENINSETSIASRESDVEVELTLKGQTLPKLTKEQQKTAYCSCLNAVDLIDSLLTRLTECIHESFLMSNIGVVKSVLLKAFGTNQGTRVSYSLRFSSSPSSSSSSSSSSSADATKNSDDEQYENSIREKILNASLQFVSKRGWSKEAISDGAQSLGYLGVTSGIFPNGGADLINYFYIQCNQKLKKHMIEVSSNLEKPIKPKDFIHNSIETRLWMLIPYIDKWAQAIAIMSLPPNVPVALANLLTLVDDICYYAGDKSVDFNWYLRRVGIGGIYKMTELYMLQDKSLDYKETSKFLDRRLSEAFQIQEVLHNSSEATTVAKDVVTSAFITARNILRVNVPR